MFIETAISEIKEFIKRYFITVHFIFFYPISFLKDLGNQVEKKYIQSITFLIINSFFFVSINNGLYQNLSAGNRNDFNSVLRHTKEATKEFSKTDDLIYLIIVSFVLYLLISIVIKISQLSGPDMTLFKTYLTYNVSANILLRVVFILIELYLLDVGLEKTDMERKKFASIFHEVEHVFRFGLLPILSLIAITTIYFKKNKSLWQTVFILIPSAIVTSVPIAYRSLEVLSKLFDHHESNITIQGIPVIKNGEKVAETLIPYPYIDSLKHVNFTLELYLYNESDKMLFIPKGNKLFIKNESVEDMKVDEDGNYHIAWNPKNYITFYIDLSKTDDQNQIIIKPNEYKKLTFDTNDGKQSVQNLEVLQNIKSVTLVSEVYIGFQSAAKIRFVPVSIVRQIKLGYKIIIKQTK